MKTVYPKGKFRFFKLLSSGRKYYNCDFYRHTKEHNTIAYFVRVELPDKKTVAMELVRTEKWTPVKPCNDIGEDIIAQMNTVIKHDLARNN